MKLKLKRGAFANLPTAGMEPGEPHFTTDRGTLEVALDATNRATIVPATETLTELASGLDMDNDFLMIHDANASGRKEKKMKPSTLKAALNIPEGTSDEKVAVASGATAGYLMDVLVTSSSVKVVRAMDGGTPLPQLYFEVDVVDGGTF